ncbi:hypothetical protein C2G38_2070901 [Gigaspora rosea]|uniref:Uncharacterized protein n=1 Tax=Gigaspora rosea TaxID=44941 RepID=A0A397VYI5_9GLOM|nr:hypothetical protein C2G38_2070901 [Gigaspora rosea]
MCCHYYNNYCSSINAKYCTVRYIGRCTGKCNSRYFGGCTGKCTRHHMYKIKCLTCRWRRDV